MRILVLFCFIFWTAIVSAQKVDEHNVYCQALKSHLAYIEKMHVKRPDLWEVADVYYLEEDAYTTKNLPRMVGHSKIEILSRSDIYEKTKNKQSVDILAIRPAQWDEGKLVVYVVEFSVSREGKHYSYVNTMDGTSYQIVYNSDTAKYSLVPL